MDKTFGFKAGLNAGRSGVRIPGQGKGSLRTISVDTRVKYTTLPIPYIVKKYIYMYIYFIVILLI